MLGAIRNGISSDDRYSSSHPKTHRAAMGFSFSPGCVKRAKECWNESRTINGSAPAAKTRKTRQLEPGASPLIVRMIGTGRIRPTRRFKNKATVERNYSGAGRLDSSAPATSGAERKPRRGALPDTIGRSRLYRPQRPPTLGPFLSKREHFEIPGVP
jgi:hypothetical protein